MFKYRLRTLLLLTVLVAVAVQFGPSVWRLIRPTHSELDLSDFVCVGAMADLTHFEARTKIDVKELLHQNNVTYFRGSGTLGYAELWVLQSDAANAVKLLENFDRGLFIKGQYPHPTWDQTYPSLKDVGKTE